METGIVIFGAGNFGKQALNYYGSRNVEAFVDNNPDKIGNQYCGKIVKSFAEICDSKDKYKVIIALNDYKDVMKQFQHHGFTNYLVYNPQYSNIVNDFISSINITKERIAVIGVEDYSGLLIDELISKIGVDSITVTDTYDSDKLGKSVIGNRVVDYESVQKSINMVIVGSQTRAYQLKAYLNRVEKREICIMNPFVQKRYYPTDKLVIIPDNSRREVTEEEFAQLAEKNPHKNQINGYFDEMNKEVPLFEHIEIETINRCNGTCDFCPVSAGHDIREKAVMSEDLFKSIIEQLADMNYSGRLATFSNNEPFLDQRIVVFNKFAREKLPNARIHLFTNGSLLTIEKFIEIIPYLDEMIIDNYNQKLEMNKNPQRIYEYCEVHPELKEKVTIVMRKEREILTTRGGDAPNRINKKSYGDIKCVLPYLQMIIRPDGKVSLCCNDPYGKVTLGDVTEQSIRDIWFGEGFNSIRKRLNEGRSGLEYCKYCDTFNVF